MKKETINVIVSIPVTMEYCFVDGELKASVNYKGVDMRDEFTTEELLDVIGEASND